jgi:ppGpp synthetase/RelA/SpoT-type nucleotidyltranferase
VSEPRETPQGPSNTQLDKLGDRLRAGSRDEADLRALDDYRRSFRTAYDAVVTTLKDTRGLEGTGRPAKTTTAIVDKLNRQKIRLTQIQDIAGLRLIVDDVLEQDRVVALLGTDYSGAKVDDRRITPSHGYRAVHVIIPTAERLVEIQVRTREQHLWAELSEKLADVVDPAIKYGGGPEEIRTSLLEHSAHLATLEAYQRHDVETAVRLAGLEASRQDLDPADPAASRLLELIAQYKRVHLDLRNTTKELRETIGELLSVDYNSWTDKNQ